MTSKMKIFNSYFHLLRLDNWFKNIFVIPGIALAYLVNNQTNSSTIIHCFLAIFATCFVASANYVINEWLDREFDKFHPRKKLRPSVINNLNPTYVYLEYIIAASLGLSIGLLISKMLFLSLLALLVMGIVYNLKPLRSKDWPIFDVLTESINNPIRFLIGWWAVSDSLVIAPSSLLLAYWLGGAYLMNIKRFSEYRFIADKKLASLYRSSFRYYTEQNLLVLSVFYAIASSIFGVVFLVKYKIELILTAPLIAGIYAWYFYIGLKPDSAAQHPELMYKEKSFITFTVITVVFALFCFFSNIPQLQLLLMKSFEFYPR